jgi:hypothetical protein
MTAKLTIDEAKEHVAWMKRTARDDRDQARIVGYEDCLREWIAAESAKQPKLTATNVG